MTLFKIAGLALGIVSCFSGLYWINRFKVRFGILLILVGSALVWFSGMPLKRQFFPTQRDIIEQELLAKQKTLDSEISDLETRLARAQIGLKKVGGIHAKLNADLVAKTGELRELLGNNVTNLQAEAWGKAEIKALASQIRNTQRLIKRCEDSIGESKEAEKSLEVALDYRKKRQMMQVVGGEDLAKADAAELASQEVSKAQTPDGGTVAIPLTEEDLRVIQEGLLKK